MAKYILGIQSYANHDTGACIIKFGNNIKPELVAISEERLIRKKYPYTFPLHSILYCMKHFKIKKFKNIDLIVSDWIREKKWHRSGPSYNYQEFDYIKEKLDIKKTKLIQINHHLAHAASTFYSSEFKSSAILIVDGNGSDVETNSYFLGYGKKIKLLKNYKYHGLGAAYGAVTKQILNLGTGGEGKTMGLAPYGRFNKKIKINYENKNIKTDFKNFMLRMPNSDVLNHIHPNYRANTIRQKVKKAEKSNIMNRLYRDWAFMIQNITEKTMRHLGNDIYKITKSKNICLAGGVALNSVANEKLFSKSKFKDIFIFPACADAGIPYGLALWGYYNYFKQSKKIKFDNAYTGINYKEIEIKKVIKLSGLKYKKINDKEIANLISNGKVIGFFNGKSEYGPRALGNRSILADPRRKYMRDYINKHIKHREFFRPFAPAILEEKSNDYFKIKKSPFMLRVAKCKYKNKIPSAMHIDNTARVQTVNKKQNPRFYSILKNFNLITGIPVVLNTSFNDAGEPLIETPTDAIISALRTNLDYLILGNNSIQLNLIAKITKKKLLSKLLNIREKKIYRDSKLSIKLLTKSYSKIEKKKKILEGNKKAVKRVLKDPILRMKNYFKKLKKNSKLFIIGTNDHTRTLIKIFKKDLSKFKSIKYFELKNNDIYQNKKKIKIFDKLNSIKYNKNNNYFISTFQYSEEIKYHFSKKRINAFNAYDNCSRSIIDYAFIKKYNNKFKMYQKII